MYDDLYCLSTDALDHLAVDLPQALTCACPPSLAYLDKPSPPPHSCLLNSSHPDPENPPPVDLKALVICSLRESSACCGVWACKGIMPAGAGAASAPRMPTRFTMAEGSISRMTPLSTISSSASNTMSNFSSMVCRSREPPGRREA
mmetsp:Transcript_46715/g.146494  ORF Transcript_46715/g.146494 Transcript_46715/m.146494 type:complete len:146 (-) Transcript_46715:321-758(-)